ncbi:MAG: hypothetical protein JNK79_19525 [Chitinophagaceae bacterium]|nr:hypothetical protein [Chitinophagaceae bacterium]
MLKLYPIAILVALSLTACRKEYSGWNVYYSSKINLVDVPANEECPAGGVLVQSGLDKNQNDILDSIEIDQTEMICNGSAGVEPGVDPGGPKQVVIQLNMMIANTGSATPIIVGAYPFFSKLYYPGYDSIVFVGRPYINPTEINRCTVELYDLTNNSVIANSTISSNKGLDETGFVVSKNLYSTLPDEEITLGIKIWSENEGMFAGVYSMYLYMYRR